MDKIIYNVASYNRIETLFKTIESIYNQSDVINVALNSYNEIPVELYDKKINLFITDNEKGDAYKFLNLSNSDGYYFTIDDDLLYPKNYSEYMISKIEEYNRNSIITLHGRNFDSFPIMNYYSPRGVEVLHFRQKLITDKKVQFGGTGVMAFHTSKIKTDIDYFKHPNMADVWIGKLAKENNISIYCVKHDKDFIKQQEFEESIYSNDLKDARIQTKLVNEAYKGKDISIIIPTFNNIEYIGECITSVINSGKNYDIEILVGIDGCKKTLNYIKNLTYPDFVKFYYFNTNNGPYDIKNSLTTITESKKILFFDSDDIMKENTIDDLIYKLDNYDYVRLSCESFSGDKIIKNNIYFGEGVFAIKKSIFLSMNGFEPWMCAADSDFVGRLNKQKVKTTKSSEIAFKYRLHQDSLTKKEKTNLISDLRNKYIEITKNKKGAGNPDKLYTRDFILVDSNTIIDDLENTESSDNSNFNNYIKTRLDLVLKPQPKKITRNQIRNKKGPIINGDLEILGNNEKSLENKIKLENSETNKSEIKTNNSINKKLFSVKTEIITEKTKPYIIDKTKFRS